MPLASASRRSGSGPARRPILAGCLLLAALAVGLFGTVVVAIDWLQGLETYSWERTRCTVESSQAVARPDGGDFAFAVAYTFDWRGTAMRGSTYRHGYSGSEDEAEARILASRYAAGEVVPCWVDSENPRDSALLRANLWTGLWIFVPLALVAVGGGGLWLVRAAMATEPAGEAPSRADVEKASPLRKAGLMVAFFGVFFLFGTGFLLPFFVWPAWRAVEARSWREVPCEVLESRVRTHPGDDSSTYSVEVLYRYEVGEREYLSDRYHFLSGSTSGRAAKQEIVDRIPAGTRTTCFVDPDDPWQAVLERGFSTEFLYGLLPLVFVLVGAGGIAFTLAAARGARRDAATPAWRPPVGERVRDPGPVTLEPTWSPFGKVVGSAVVALVWNGIVALFVWKLVEEWRAGHHDWFLVLFLAPFVLIGALIAAGVPYALLALLNPRPRLRLSRRLLRPGESAQVEWSFRGLAGRVRKLSIRLVGERRAGGGRDQGEPFATVAIAERRHGHGLEFGAASLTVPDDAPPTSRDDGEAVSWKLELHGEIAYWPDVQEEYEITVLGHDSAGGA